MLKIYLMKITYEIQNKDKIINLKSYSNYMIEEEQDAVSTTGEFSAYANNISKLYDGYCYVDKKKKGNLAMFLGCDRSIYLKEWKYPDAKLVKSISYQEAKCSMKQLFELNSNDVIAYLKQEGMVLPTPS